MLVLNPLKNVIVFKSFPSKDCDTDQLFCYQWAELLPLVLSVIGIGICYIFFVNYPPKWLLPGWSEDAESYKPFLSQEPTEGKIQ